MVCPLCGSPMYARHAEFAWEQGAEPSWINDAEEFECRTRLGWLCLYVEGKLFGCGFMSPDGKQPYRALVSA